MKTYLVQEALLAVAPAAEDGPRLVTIPQGAVVELRGNSPEKGLVEVTWHGRGLSVFLQDLEDRSAKMRAMGA